MAADNRREVKVFMTSSYSALSLAQKLANELTDYRSAVVTVVPVKWWERPEGSYISSTLTNQTDECDFAAVLLTEEDMETPRGDRTRDNCIYEAGLFLGALGDPARCFLLISCNPRKLPSDLAGLTYINIAEASIEVERTETENTIKQAACRIGQAIEEFVRKGQLRAIRGLKLPMVTVEELLRSEQPEKTGGVLLSYGAKVVVNSPQLSVERSDEFARRVISNMVEYGTTYTHVLEASRSNVLPVTWLIAKLASVDGVEQFTKNIDAMRQNLQMYFVPDRRGLGLQYCIYNADDYDAAVCYVRTPHAGKAYVEWIRWARGAEAVGMTEEIERICIEERDERIFRSTIYFDLYKKDDQRLGEFRKRLWYSLRSQCQRARGAEFSESDGELLAAACFGETYAEELRAAANE